MKTLIRKFSVVTSVSVIMFLSSFSQGFAEDIEIYSRLQTEPNVLFIIDQSESMLQPVGSTGKTRDQIVKEAFTTVMSQSYDNLNVGFMDYGRDNGAGVDLPVADINQLAKSVEPGVASTTETYASLLSRFANNLEGPQSGAKTALVEALLEAAKYYRGDVIDNLSQGIGNQGTWNDSLSQYTGGDWRAAGPRTLTTGGSTAKGGSYCHQAGSPAGAPYNQCNNPYPGSCTNLSANSGNTNTCTGGYTCTEYDITGTECVKETCNSFTSKPWSHPAYTRCQETSSSTAKTYNSPIQSACTENFIVLLSDGAPTILGSHEQTSIQGFAGTSSCTDLSTLGFTNSSILSKGICGPDLTQAISTLDIAPGITGTQTVDTYTIGFDLGSGANEAKTYLELLATNGNGQFFDANGTGGVTSLVTIFQSIFNTISQKPRVISRIATSPDLSNLGATRPEVYMPLFVNKPNQPRWTGNLKGYLVGANGQIVDTSTPAKPAFVAGEFNTAASSFWSTSDGGSIDQGGLASILPNPTTRNLLTEDTSGNLIDLEAGTTFNTDPTIFGNAGLTPTDIDNLIDWVNGEDVFDEDGDSNTTEARNFVGDALHSNPVVVSYDESGSDGIVDRIVTFFMTNEGLLHAIDDKYSINRSTNTATELFAYMPRDLLANLEGLKNNTEGNAKIYGLDGPLVYHQEGGVRNLAGNKYLFFGMRRGGNNYYGMDVTDPDNPVLMWTINGGYGDFKELGQTWSTPIVTKVDDGGTIKTALVFGAGYDVDQDATNAWVADDQGRAIYIVDALSGAKLWSAGGNSGLTNPAKDTHDLNLAMDNAVAADVSVIDFDQDDLVDRIYFGDVGGHIWRIDIQGDVSSSSNTSGYLFADLHDNTTANNRRFFSRPSAALTKRGMLALSIGSGNRAHPLQGVNNVDRVTDRFYTLFDPHSAKGDIPSSFSAISDAALQDLTGFSAGFDTSGLAGGWRVDLQTDEKVFSSPRVILGEVFFTTYVPPANECSSIPDGSNLYVLTLDGEPSRDLDATTTSTRDAFVPIYTTGINGEIVITVAADGNNVYGNTGPNDPIPLIEKVSLDDLSWTNNPPPPPPPLVTP